MPDINLGEHIEKNGLNFKSLFREILSVSASIFIGFYWKDLFTEYITTFMPEGHNLVEKTTLGIFVTIAVVIFIYIVNKKQKE